MGNPMLREEGRIARQETGATRFLPSVNHRCKEHGGEHYTTSGRCCECTRKAKDPAKQAAYWARRKEAINQRRREAYKAD